jgi:hypothetical protein
MFTMVKALTKQTFGAPSAELVDRIESSDMAHAARAAGYRYEAKLGELDRQYEAKAGAIREAYLAERAGRL